MMEWWSSSLWGPCGELSLFPPRGNLSKWAWRRDERGCHAHPMPSFRRGDIVIHYIERGEGFPLLLFAPGGMRSASGFWKNSPWNPVDGSIAD